MVQVQSADLMKAYAAMGGMQNPVKAVGSVFGFSGDEVDAGVPTWAWVVVGIGVGIYLGKKASQKGIL